MLNEQNIIYRNAYVQSCFVPPVFYCFRIVGQNLQELQNDRKRKNTNCQLSVYIDYFIVRIFSRGRVRVGVIFLTLGNGNFLATGFLFRKYISFFFLTTVRLELSGSGFLTLTLLDLTLDYGKVRKHINAIIFTFIDNSFMLSLDNLSIFRQF